MGELADTEVLMALPAMPFPATIEELHRVDDRATVAGFTASRLPDGIFGFQEKGLNPSPQGAAALIGEIVAAVVLFGSFAWDRDLLRRTKSADVGNATSNVDKAGMRR